MVVVVREILSRKCGSRLSASLHESRTALVQNPRNYWSELVPQFFECSPVAIAFRTGVCAAARIVARRGRERAGEVRVAVLEGGWQNASGEKRGEKYVTGCA